MQMHLVKLKLSTDTMQMANIIRRNSTDFELAPEDTRKALIGTHLKTMDKV